MHAFEFNNADGEVTIHYNSDFSGDAIIETGDPKGTVRTFVSCEALLAFAAEYVRNRKISSLEQAGHREILNGHFV